MNSDQIKHTELDDLERFRMLSAFSEGLKDCRLQFKTLSNYNQYQVASAVMTVDILDQPIDISALAAYTRMHRSTLYNTLNRMTDSGMLELYCVKGDNKRKYVRATPLLANEYFSFLNDIQKLITITHHRLTKT